MSTAVIGSVAGFVLLGTLLYLLDRRYGIHLYRWLYNLTHGNPIPENEERGFVVQQHSKRQWSVAFAIATLLSVYSQWGGHGDLVGAIFTWVLTIPSMLVGFWLGSPAYRLAQRRDKAFQVMDKINDAIEHGEPKKVAATALADLMAGGRGWLRQLSSPTVATPPQPAEVTPPPVVSESITPPPAPPPENPFDTLRKFTRRQRP